MKPVFVLIPFPRRQAAGVRRECTRIVPGYFKTCTAWGVGHARLGGGGNRGRRHARLHLVLRRARQRRALARLHPVLRRACHRRSLAEGLLSGDERMPREEEREVRLRLLLGRLRPMRRIVSIPPPPRRAVPPMGVALMEDCARRLPHVRRCVKYRSGCDRCREGGSARDAPGARSARARRVERRFSQGRWL